MNKTTMTAAALLLAAAARAGGPAPAEKARVQELRASVKDGERRLKQAALDQHKELVLVRDREKADAVYVKSSASMPETIHAGLLEVHEKSRRDRIAVRARRREERARLLRAMKAERAEIAALRRKK